MCATPQVNGTGDDAAHQDCGPAFRHSCSYFQPVVGDETGAAAEEPRAGFGKWALSTPPAGTPLLGPHTLRYRPGTGDQGYWRYGVGRMRRGGLEPEGLERDHIVIEGKGVNYYGTDSLLGTDRDGDGRGLLRTRRAQGSARGISDPDRAAQRRHPFPSQLQRAGPRYRPSMRMYGGTEMRSRSCSRAREC